METYIKLIKELLERMDESDKAVIIRMYYMLLNHLNNKKNE